MRARIFAALGAVAVAGAVTLGTVPSAFAATSAPAATQMDCDNAKAATATAQMTYNSALAVVVARAKELGFTADQIAKAEMLLQQGPLTDQVKAQLQMLYSEHNVTGVNVVTDLPKLSALLNAKLALDAAVAAQNIACAGMAAPAPTATPAMPAPMIMPRGGAATGDSGLAN